MKIRVIETINEFKRHFGLNRDGILLEPDLDEIETECDLDSRKRRDAEVLCTLAANISGPCLDLGTSHGRSAYKLATNLGDRGRVFTVNVLPEQMDSTCGKMITHALEKEQIGAYFRNLGIANIEQHYANTARWDVPPQIADLALVFVDAAHDTEMVWSDSHLILPRVAEGGFIVWHDFSPPLRQKWDWIDASMRGVEKFLAELGAELEVVHLRGSWTAVWRKTTSKSGRATPPATASEPRWTSGCPDDCTQSLVGSAPSGAGKVDDPFRQLRVLWVYPRYSEERALEEEGWANRIRALGYNIELFGVPCPDGWWPFPKLDAAWKRRVPELMQSYERIASSARRGDILATSGGAMVHPEFVQQLPTFNVFICGDDPESSEILSKPAAPAFDVSLIGNVACIDLYRSWGCRHVDWLYQAIRPELSDPTLTEDRILSEPRDLDLVMLCERIYNASDRASRVEQLHRTFPNAFIRGRGWPGGHVEPAPVYRRAKIGWNLHNSVGPCNTRLVTLPAFGVMQICDNKANLGQLFKLDDEVVGFDSIEECVEKTRYYLAHDLERRQIAVRGWKRAMAEFTEEKQWSRLLEKISVPYREKFSKLNPARVSAGPVSASRARRSFDDRRVGVAVAPRGRVSYEPALVRELIGQAISLYTGGQSDLGTLLSGGESVLIKPNWVLHLNKSGETMDCMVTHSEFLLAAVELVAARRPARIVIADAPLQRCQWDLLVTPPLVAEIHRRAPGVPIQFVDFRRTVMHAATLGADVERELRHRDRYTLFDLAADSLLEPITGDANFRVTMYDPEELAKTHRAGRHQYLLARDVFEADVVLNLPKLKTHRKSGLTAALKNLVGINGNKDYLPHHRMGGSDVGGDCYPGFAWWKHAAEIYYDQANGFIGTPLHDVWVARAERLLALYGRFYDPDIEGGWHGNDTCWRMVLDLNRCLLYGDASGRLHDTPQRRVFSLTDAITAGHGEGPLAPRPLPLGAVTFAESSAAADLAHGALFRFDHRQLALLKGCFAEMRFPILPSQSMPQFVTPKGLLDYESLALTYGHPAEPPRGWKSHCELSQPARQTRQPVSA